jgi:trehalose/maltose hydrolase-like predicted phosphorylase
MLMTMAGMQPGHEGDAADPDVIRRTKAPRTPTRGSLALSRRFEALVFDWDTIVVPDRPADAARLRPLIEEASTCGLEVALVSRAHLDSVDPQLDVRPHGPGGLVLAVDRGAEVFSVGSDGPRLVYRCAASETEELALSRAAQLAVQRLASRGLVVRMVCERPHRRTIDLVPEGECADPAKASIRERLEAVEQQFHRAGIGGLSEAVAIIREAATDAGLSDPRVSSDATYVQIGLTDKSDSVRWIGRWLWQLGIAPEQILVAGDSPGRLDRGGPDVVAAVLEDQLARRRRGELPIPVEDPRWTLAITGIDPLLERAHESLLTLADGRLGTRGSVLIEHASGDPSVLMSGVYARRGAETHLLEAPRWNTIRFGHGLPAPVRRVLDLHAGVLHQQLGSAEGGLEALLLSSLPRPATAVLRVRDRSRGMRLTQVLEPPPGAACERGEADRCAWMRVSADPGSIAVAAHDHVRGPCSDRVFDRVAGYEGAGHHDADQGLALDRVTRARNLGFDRLLGEHRHAWASRWEDADVVIEGDPELQCAVRFALFHLLASASEDGEAAVGARGLSGSAYRGHVFWDSDVYVLPFLAATRPAAARAMLEYRVRRLPAARHAARAQTRTGARFPWESADSGQDVTPERLRDRRGEMLPVLTGKLEEHIVADVAWAAACYIDWTGDEAFARGAGREMMVQTARWWASRIEHDDDGRGHIRGVIGPDEYHAPVDDNAFTNVMARWNLRRAADAAADTVEEPERRRWLELADTIADGYDPTTRIYEQFAGFHRLEPLLIADLAPQRPVAADMLLGHERTRRAQVIKQADALMLHYMVPAEVAPGSLAPNLEFYEPRTAHGSTLSPGVHAALLARAGRLDEAVETLHLTARIDLDDVGHMTAGGLHVAAMGSVWRALAFGFAGLRPVGDALALDPVIAPAWDSLELRARFRGSRVRIQIHPDAVHAHADPPIAALTPAGERIELDESGQTFELIPRSGSDR